MRVGFGLGNEATPAFLKYAAQFGATDVRMAAGAVPARNGRWELQDLVKLRGNPSETPDETR